MTDSDPVGRFIVPLVRSGPEPVLSPSTPQTQTHPQIGSIFEYIYRNPIFGVLPSTSVLYTPILFVFAFTGLPMAGLLFKKAIDGANAMAERQDRADGL